MKSEVKERVNLISKGQVPKGYQKTQDGIYPNEWNYIKLGDYLVKYVEKSVNDNSIPILTSSRNGLMLQKDYYANREVITKEDSEYGVLPRGYFTYRHMSDDLTFKFNINTIVDKGLISPEYPVFTTKGIDDYFLLLKLNEGSEFKRYAISKKRGSTRTRMYYSVLEDLQVIVPTLSEQKKITTILSVWDKAITLIENLIEQKKQQKKGLLQKLLTGKVRLPGFEGKWEKVKLKNILEVRREKSTIKKELELYSLTIEDGVTPKTEKYNREFLVKSDVKEYKITYCNDIVYNPANLRFGAIAVNKIQKPVLLSPIYETLYISDKTKFDVGFIGQFLTWERQIRLFSTMAEGTLVERMAVKVDSFLEMYIFMPVDFREQTAISQILETADKEFTLQSQILEQLKQQRKGLIKLFLTGKLRVSC